MVELIISGAHSKKFLISSSLLNGHISSRWNWNARISMSKSVTQGEIESVIFVYLSFDFQLYTKHWKLACQKYIAWIGLTFGGKVKCWRWCSRHVPWHYGRKMCTILKDSSRFWQIDKEQNTNQGNHRHLPLLLAFTLKEFYAGNSSCDKNIIIITQLFRALLYIF